MNTYEKLASRLSEYKDEDISFVLDEPMKNHTSFKIGGNASMFVSPRSSAALEFVHRSAAEAGCRIYVLGRGTNVLFDDAGYDGVVISTLGLDSFSEDGSVLTFGAGFSFTNAAKCALERSLGGLTFAYGIPGSVGGAVYMNAGAYGGEVSNILCRSTYLDTSSGKVSALTAEEHLFSYRNSVYMMHPERIILDASFSLKPGDKAEIKAEMDDFMTRRRTKQPLEFPSAGSAFKRYPGRYTGQMIEELGLKGSRRGGAEISEKHAGFIINRGNATSSDVLNLIDFVKGKINEAYGIDIECEVIHVK